ncbi:MAG TPA: aminotransferase class III-fold pyridoxal phosphate-dependent enzyme, partial [Verrucomicrobiae bacterium]|nr:aminotransferase class III-fold pyridoxal phosphate-dependent enzyme [Verrucomicrobiae bacterium]
GNQLGASAALANLKLLQDDRLRTGLEKHMRDEAKQLWELPNVGDVREVGVVMGVELVRDWTRRKPFKLVERAGIRVCEAMARRGVLTRPIGNVIVIMPPYCTTRAQVRKIFQVLRDSVAETFGC